MTQLGGFVSTSARTRFTDHYFEAMKLWPAHTGQLVPTSYGLTQVHRAGPDTATPIVLLPGGRASSAAMATTAKALAQHHTVYCVDIIGDAGLSRQQAAAPDAKHLTTWLDETLDAIAVDRIHLVGYSYGGWLALKYAAAAPRRITSLTALEPAAALAGIKPGPLLRILLTSLIGTDAARRRYLAWCRGGRTPAEPMLSLLISAMRDFRQRGLPAPRRLDDDELAAVEAPAQVLLATRSVLHDPRRALARCRELLPQARAEILDASHALPSDLPDEVNSRILDFITHVTHSQER